MTQLTKLGFSPVRLATADVAGVFRAAGGGGRNVEEGQGLVLLRGLPTLGTVHSVAIVELDPGAAIFGAIRRRSSCRNSPTDASPVLQPHRTAVLDRPGSQVQPGRDRPLSQRPRDPGDQWRQLASTPGGNRSART